MNRFDPVRTLALDLPEPLGDSRQVVAAFGRKLCPNFADSGNNGTVTLVHRSILQAQHGRGDEHGYHQAQATIDFGDLAHFVGIREMPAIPGHQVS
jgi:hypothetical protein